MKIQFKQCFERRKYHIRSKYINRNQSFCYTQKSKTIHLQTVAYCTTPYPSKKISIKRFRPILGFTLVELLVAIAIFAILAALGWKVIDYLIKIKTSNVQHEEQLFTLQEAYQQILRDSVQMVPLAANMNGQLQPALSLNNNNLQFSKAGVTDPLGQGLSPYERIEYRYDAAQKIVYRLQYRDLNLSSSVQPQSSILLKHVDNFQVQVLNPEPTTYWPEPNNNVLIKSNFQTLPRGIKFEVTLAQTQYEWVYALLDAKPIVDNLQKNTD